MSPLQENTNPDYTSMRSLSRYFRELADHPDPGHETAFGTRYQRRGPQAPSRDQEAADRGYTYLAILQAVIHTVLASI